MSMTKHYINPNELFPSLQYGFSQIVTTTAAKTVYLSGQVAWDADQQIVGPGDLKAQVWQVFRNIELAMHTAGGSLDDVVSLRIYIVDDKLDESRCITEALQHFFLPEQAPATTWIGVRSLADEDFLVEIEAIGTL